MEQRDRVGGARQHLELLGALQQVELDVQHAVAVEEDRVDRSRVRARRGGQLAFGDVLLDRGEPVGRAHVLDEPFLLEDVGAKRPSGLEQGREHVGAEIGRAVGGDEIEDAPRQHRDRGVRDVAVMPRRIAAMDELRHAAVRVGFDEVGVPRVVGGAHEQGPERTVRFVRGDEPAGGEVEEHVPVGEYEIVVEPVRAEAGGAGRAERFALDQGLDLAARVSIGRLVVLPDRLAEIPGGQHEAAHAGGREAGEDVVEDGPAAHRQHRLRQRVDAVPEARAPSAAKDEGLSDRHHGAVGRPDPSPWCRWA